MTGRYGSYVFAKKFYFCFGYGEKKCWVVMLGGGGSLAPSNFQRFKNPKKTFLAQSMCNLFQSVILYSGIYIMQNMVMGGGCAGRWVK